MTGHNLSYYILYLVGSFSHLVVSLLVVSLLDIQLYIEWIVDQICIAFEDACRNPSLNFSIYLLSFHFSSEKTYQNY